MSLLFYFGDTAHMPYGERSPELISKYALRITDFLLHEKGCKAIVIACNTASAAAYEALRDKYRGSFPVINVIDPMIEEVIQDEGIGHLGIIATRTTINSGVYQEKLSRRKPSLTFAAMATPLLATVIEEGFSSGTISSAVLEQYLSADILRNIDGLVLACTHYPLIKEEINRYYDGKVKIFDSAEIVARKLQWILQKESLAANEKSEDDIFFVTDFTKTFNDSTRIFFPRAIQLERSGIWDVKK